MSYDYDIFISYKRHKLSDPWFLKLRDRIEFHLSEELQRDAKIFIDQEDIKTGDRWRAKLGTSLKKSRCIVCFWSPRYFQSKWCVAELDSFLKRSNESGCDLVVPARYFDGKHYPAPVKEWQSQDMSDYTVASPQFWDSELGLKFEHEVLRPFIKDIGAKVQSAPDYHDDFPLVDEPNQDLMILTPPKIEKP